MDENESVTDEDDVHHAFEAADQESDNEMADSERVRAFDGYDDDSDNLESSSTYSANPQRSSFSAVTGPVETLAFST
jgi:hypothetical protein